ncbi:hypothetical protein HDU98_004228 [Podochytrium sp. JEL0797]|nr:hypothetical protein HDU98_004228 [Podochytrium sp. JEL0797]
MSSRTLSPGRAVSTKASSSSLSSRGAASLSTTRSTALKPPSKKDDSSSSAFLIEAASDPKHCDDALARTIKARLAQTPASLSKRTSRLGDSSTKRTTSRPDSVADLASNITALSLAPQPPALSLQQRSLKSFATKLLSQTTKTIHAIPAAKIATVAPAAEPSTYPRKPVSKRPSTTTSTAKPRSATPSTTPESQPFSALTQIAFDCSVALAKLERFESIEDSAFLESTNQSNSNAPLGYWSFETEKLLSNVITRLVEQEQYTHALRLLRHLHPRLSSEPDLDLSSLSLGPSKPHNLATPPEPVTAIKKPQPRSRTASSSSLITKKPSTISLSKHEQQAEVFISPIMTDLYLLRLVSSTPEPHPIAESAKSADLPSWVIPSHNTDTDTDVTPHPNLTPPTSLIASTLFNAMRCLMSMGLYTQNAEACESLVLGEFGLLSWCTRFTTGTDKVAGGKMCDAVFRWMYKFAGTLTDPVRAFACKLLAIQFFVKASSFTMDLFCDVAVRAASGYEKALGPAMSSTLITKFYTSILDTFETLTPTHLKPSHLLLLDHCATISHRLHLPLLQSRGSLLTRQICTTVSEPASACMAASIVCWLEVDAFVSHLDTLSVSDVSAESQLICTRAREFQHLIDAMPATTPEESIVHMTRVYSRVLETCKKAAASANLAPDSSVGMDNIIQSLLGCFGFWICRDSSGAGLARKLAPTVIQLYLSLVTIRQTTQPSLSKYDDFSSLLSRAVEICEMLAFGDGLSWISTACYNAGTKHFQSREYATAAGWFKSSCDFFERGRLIRGATDEDARLITKRWESVVVCMNAAQDVEGTVDALRGLFARLPVGEVEAGNGVVCKSVEKVLKIMHAHPQLSQLHLAHFLPQDTPMSTRVAVLEYEFQFVTGLGDTAKACGVVDAILGVVEGAGERGWPVRRARVLIRKANLVRVSKGREGLREAVEACVAAVGLLMQEGEEWGMDAEIAATRFDDLAFAQLTLGICRNEMGEYDAVPFREAVEGWKRLVDGVGEFPGSCQANVEQVRTQFACLEQTYKNMASLADTFGILNQPTNQIQALHLMLSLLQIHEPRNSCKLEESMQILSRIAHAHLSLGYTGKAGQVLVQAQGLIESHEASGLVVNPQVLSMWRLSYAYYLCSIGSFEKG